LKLIEPVVFRFLPGDQEIGHVLALETAVAATPEPIARK